VGFSIEDSRRPLNNAAGIARFQFNTLRISPTCSANAHYQSKFNWFGDGLASVFNVLSSALLSLLLEESENRDDRC
jgi:hypothetical protein